MFPVIFDTFWGTLRTRGVKIKYTCKGLTMI
jgi:hypothetical protein